ncbi:alpha-ketoglutarate-dependent dioxygenase AlkB family protein [Paeniglutamicibacter cryotolerans]|uniref:Alkylated DNA repair protein (DNA oxidative demethylase) n=1 Tax=Paeniglutamicibacter cryotolerans TaxID=670079 RepID=A0A839QL70_9MICC|nr:alpha-ketoglutarate-dependent dioxygenase AlkB [Paeniglutamicibacter cryotolerans]MBB2995514.1 alkylated DNA repair protein (DNA oxidative demethylase) [Paeniglutamicibacter cryotolerans]
MDALFGDDLLPRHRRTIAPGAVHLPGWLDTRQQSWLTEQFRIWAAGPVPARAAIIGGHPMSVRTVCLGWHWRPYAYSREALDVNGNRVLEFPDWLAELGRRAVADAYPDRDPAAEYAPDAALANYYDEEAKMGMHQDRDELSLEPVVSLSLGDTGLFRFGNSENRNRPHTDLELRSGDLFVFGGPSRLAYHGVTRILPGTAPADCGLECGRINITLRVTGMAESNP